MIKKRKNEGGERERKGAKHKIKKHKEQKEKCVRGTPA